MADLLALPEQRRADALLADLERLRDARCHDCGAGICGHQSVISVVMGFKDAPRCVNCLAASLDREPTAFRDHAIEFISRRACWMQGWLWASRHEGHADSLRPACLWGGPDDSDHLGWGHA